MLEFFGLDSRGLQRRSQPSPGADLKEILWIDALAPSAEEADGLRQSLGVELPSLADMREIETSNRLREEDGVLHLTATVLMDSGHDTPANHPVTFILTDRQLISNRHADSLGFQRYREFAASHGRLCRDPGAVLAGLLEAFVNSIADTLERTSDEMDRLSAEVFAAPNSRRVVGVRDYRPVLERVGHLGDLNSKARESLASLARLLIFVQQLRPPHINEHTWARFRVIARDLHQMGDHAVFLASKVQFTLDATLGMITIEQNNTLKIFSVVTVLLLPPSVIAASFGMNFRHLPGIEHPLGFTLVALIMILSAILPFAIFRRRGWL